MMLHHRFFSLVMSISLLCLLANRYFHSNSLNRAYGDTLQASEEIEALHNIYLPIMSKALIVPRVIIPEGNFTSSLDNTTTFVNKFLDR